MRLSLEASTGAKFFDGTNSMQQPDANWWVAVERQGPQGFYLAFAELYVTLADLAWSL